MKKKANLGSMYDAVMGDATVFNISHRTYNVLNIIFGFLSLMMVPVAFLYGNIVEGLALFFCSLCFIYAYFRSRWHRVRLLWVFTVSMYALFALIFFLFAGFKGYGLFLYLISYIALMSVTQDKPCSFAFRVTIANVVLLLLFDLCFPNASHPIVYSSKQMMWLFFVLILIVLNLITSSLKKNFIDDGLVVKNQMNEFESLLKNVTSSVQYASNIQNALLPKEEKLDQILEEHFVFYKPRDIVSGDFYWVEQVDGKTVVIAADCTGHGVPGAFMSMLGISLLNEIVLSKKVLHAGEILDLLRDQVKRNIPGSRDGMDIAVVVIDQESMTAEFAGANNPLYLMRDGEMHEYKGNRQPVGRYAKETEFTSQLLELRKGDLLYVFSDGYYDQVGGEAKKKYLIKNFKEFLLSIHQLPLKEQKERLELDFEAWKNASGLKHQLTFGEIDTIYFLLNENALQSKDKRYLFRERLRELEYYNIENLTKIIAECYTPELAEEIFMKLKTSGNQVDDVLVFGFKV